MKNKLVTILSIILCFSFASCKQTPKVEESQGGDALSSKQAAAQEVEQVYIVGTMSDNGCNIELALQMPNDGFYSCAGYVLYPESEPTLVVGISDKYFGDDGGDCYNNISLTEYQPDGTVSGKFLIHLREADDSDTFTFEDAERTYIQIDEEDQTAPIIDVRICSTQMPEWFPETPFIPAKYEDIASDYGYYLRGPDAYGEVQIKKLGNGKLSFIADESREDNTVSTLISEEGRPAELVDNYFEYSNVNKCGYTLTARFYKKFMVLSTRQEAPSSEPYCPYINAAFIKRK